MGCFVGVVCGKVLVVFGLIGYFYLVIGGGDVYVVVILVVFVKVFYYLQVDVFLLYQQVVVGVQVFVVQLVECVLFFQLIGQFVDCCGFIFYQFFWIVDVYQGEVCLVVVFYWFDLQVFLFGLFGVVQVVFGEVLEGWIVDFQGNLFQVVVCGFVVVVVIQCQVYLGVGVFWLFGFEVGQCEIVQCLF